jgi:peptidoglycan/LPS O-acetylase OafA/YrhL
MPIPRSRLAKPSGRVFGLDVLRAVAIVAVVHGHGGTLVQHQVNAFYYNPLILDGVSIFFVLSGFLIGRILIDMYEDGQFRTRDVLQFWIRRWFRTLPSYYLVLGFLIVLFVYRIGIWSWEFDQLLTFTQNLTHGPPNWFEEAWSLAVEEWFYFGVPILLFAVKRLRHGLLAVIVGVIFASMAYRTYRVFDLGLVFKQNSVEWGEQIAMPVVCRLETIMIGVLGAYLMKHSGDVLRRYGMPLFGLGAALTVACGHMMFLKDPSDQLALFMNVFYVTTHGIGTLLMLPMLSTIRSCEGVAASVVTFISKISYPMYLTNLVLVQLTILPLIMVPQGFLALATYWAMTIGLSFAIHKTVEMPVMNLRDRLRLLRSLSRSVLTPKVVSP